MVCFYFLYSDFMACLCVILNQISVMDFRLDYIGSNMHYYKGKIFIFLNLSSLSPSRDVYCNYFVVYV